MARQTHEDFVARPFENLPGETDWVALHDIVPVATATARTTKEHGARDVIVATMLPGAMPAWHRSDGAILLGLQNRFSSADASRDLAQATLAAIAAPANTDITRIDIAADGPRLQDILDPEVPFEVTVHETFDFWVAEGDEEMRKAVDDFAEADIAPTFAVDGLTSGYWTQFGTKPFLRWVRGEDEDELIDALARLQAKRQAGVVEGAKYAGAFRACGLMVPVWELPTGTDAATVADAAPSFSARLDEALAQAGPLTSDERRARAGLVARSVTLR